MVRLGDEAVDLDRWIPMLRFDPSGDRKGQVSREEWERIAERSREERGKAVS
jgi:hypothetical protein